MKFSVHFCKYFFTLEVNFWPPCVKELGTGGGGLLGAGGTCTGISGGCCCCCCCCCCCIIWNCMNCCAWLLLELKLMRIINYISTINLYNEMLRGEAEFKSLMIAVFDVWCDMLLAARGGGRQSLMISVKLTAWHRTAIFIMRHCNNNHNKHKILNLKFKFSPPFPVPANLHTEVNHE